jgi:hypothetical protein
LLLLKSGERENERGAVLTAIPITIVSAADRQAGAENIDFYDFRIYHMNKNPNITTTT